MSRNGWTLVRRVRNNFLPGDIRSILVARLDQLAFEVKASVQTASVLGREFTTLVLSQMLREEESVHKYIAEAEKAAIWAPLNETRYIFSHGLLRDAAYEMQMRSRRQELHARALEVVERLYSDHLSARYAELAYHAENAELHPKAQQYYTLAGKFAAESYQNHLAIDYFTRALAFTPTEGLSTQFSLLVERVQIFNRRGDRDAQAADLHSLERLALQLAEPWYGAKVDVLFAHYHLAIGDYPAVVQRSEAVMELNHLMEDAEIILDMYRGWPLALLRTGKFGQSQ